MSESPGKIRVPELLENFGVITALEHDDCNLVANETYVAANNAILDQRKDFFPIIDGDCSHSQTMRTKRLYTIQNDNGEGVEIHLARAVSKHTEVIRRGILRRSVTLGTEQQAEHATIIAQIGEDSFLPLASFGLEADTACKYVQIGSEMRDSSLVMTPLDEGTSRHEVVEALRSIIRKDTSQRKAKWIVECLTQKQLAEHAEQAAEANEAMLVRRCQEKMADAKHTRQLCVLEGNDNSFVQKVRIAPLLEDIQLTDGRRVQLVLAQYKEHVGNSMQIMAVTAGYIGLPIATLPSDGGRVTFNNPVWDRPGEERQERIDALLARLRNKPYFNPPDYVTPKDYSYIPHPEHSHSQKNTRERVFATYGFEHQLLKEDEGAIKGRGYGLDLINWAVDGLYQKLEAFLADPELGHFGYPDSKVLQLILSRLPIKQRAARMLLEPFDIEARLRSFIGETSVEEERVVRYINAIAPKPENEFTRLLEAANTGKSKVDLQIKGIVRRNGTQYKISLFSKPAASSEDFGDEPYYEFSFDTLKPLFKRDKDRAAVESEAAKLYELLTWLSPRTNLGASEFH